VRQPFAVVHLDESCLGNGREGDNPGGAGGLIEVKVKGQMERRDVYLSAPATTNNRMALSGAIAVLDVLGGKGRRVDVLMVSDSQYLVKGMTAWVRDWEARGWKRRDGQIENLELWQRLVASAGKHDAEWRWVRGHKGHPKNEYANDLAIKAAREQITSLGAVESGFPAWLQAKQAKGMFVDYDPDAAFKDAERR
jgi:ribonuclease HI